MEDPETRVIVTRGCAARRVPYGERSGFGSPDGIGFKWLTEWLADLTLGQQLIHALFDGRISAWREDARSGHSRFFHTVSGLGLPRDGFRAVQVFLGEAAPLCFPEDVTFALYGALTSIAAPSFRTALVQGAARRSFRMSSAADDANQSRIAQVREWCAGVPASDARALRLAFDRACIAARVEYELGITTDVAHAGRLRAVVKHERSDWESKLNDRNASVRRLLALTSQR